MIKLFSSALLLVLGMSPLPRASAATLTFDANTAIAGAQDGSGTWSTTAQNWYNGTADVVWPNTTDTAIFGVGGTSGTVTVSGTVNAAAITFNQGGYTLSGGTVNANPASGTTFLFTTTGGTSTVSSGFSIAAGTQFRKTGSGILSMAGTSGGTAASPLSVLITGGTYSATTGYFDSILSVGLLNFFGAQPTNLTTEVILDAGTIRLTGTNSYAGATMRRIQVNAAGGAIIDGGGSGTQSGSVLGVGNYYSSPIVNNAAAASSLYLSNTSGSTAFQGAISGTGSITWNGAGTLALGAFNNSYTGGTVVRKGTLQLTNGSLGSNSLTLAAGTVLSLQNAVLPFTVSSTGVDQLLIQTGTVTVGGLNNIRLNAGSGFGPGTYTVLSAPAGGLAGSYEFDGGFNLTVPTDPTLTIPALVQIKNVNGAFYRLTLQNSATAEQVVVATATAPVVNIMPLGSSSTQGINPDSTWNGGGYRSGLYQRLVNDGRFTPHFVGSSNVLSAGSTPTGYNVLTGANENYHEGHGGYKSYDLLQNLNGNGGEGGNNGGYWLTTDSSKPGFQVNPDYVTLNIGGNDYAADPNETTAPVDRVDALLTLIQTLRPNARVVVGNLVYRTDTATVGPLQNTWFNPRLPGVVFNHTLAGYDLSMVDSYSVLSPGDSIAYLSSDHLHPTQTGYNIYSNVFYRGVVYGAAYWTGVAQGGQWSTVTGAGGTNFALNRARTVDRGAALDAATDVYFNANTAALSTTLGADLAVRSVNFTAGAAGPVTVGGANTLSLGMGGLTVQAGTGAHVLSAGVALTADQTWGNVSANALTVGGSIGGGQALTLTGTATLQVQTAPGTSTTASQSVSGSGAFIFSGANTYSGGTTLVGGATLTVANATGSGTGTGAVNVAGGSTLTNSNGTVGGALNVNGLVKGSGSFGAAVTVNSGGVFSATGSVGGDLRVIGGGTLAVDGGTLTVTGNVINDGTIRLTRGASLVVASGSTFTNRGTLDVISGSFQAPGGFQNTGTLLEASLTKVESTGLAGGVFTLSLNGYTGHTYQLQRSGSPDGGSFTNLGSSRAGTTGTRLSFSDPSPPASSAFYRVQVDP